MGYIEDKFSSRFLQVMRIYHRKYKFFKNSLRFLSIQHLQVGDNSAVNLLPILAEPVKEGLQYDLLDEEGDVLLPRILPFSAKIDPDTIPFVWKSMG